MLFREMTIYCKRHIKPIYCVGKMQSVLMLNQTVHHILTSVPERGAQILRAWSLWRQNILPWCLVFSSPQHGTLFMSHTWGLEFEMAVRYLENQCTPVSQTDRKVHTDSVWWHHGSWCNSLRGAKPSHLPQSLNSQRSKLTGVQASN